MPDRPTIERTINRTDSTLTVYERPEGDHQWVLEDPSAPGDEHEESMYTFWLSPTQMVELRDWLVETLPAV